MKNYFHRLLVFINLSSMVLSGYSFSSMPTDTVPEDSVKQIVRSAVNGGINANALPEALYKSPEAKAFQEYGKFATEGCSGSIDISIPIHTISCRNLEIPITLHYGGKGIKVAEEASWVGLGWDLSVGGCINLVSAGQVDFLTREAQWSDYLKVLNLESGPVFQKTANRSDYTVMGDLINNMGERDFYSVNILGQGFLFFINPDDGKPIIIGADDKDYFIQKVGAEGWLIRDVMGYEYEFDAIEYSLMDNAGMQKSAWYMSSILTPEGIEATFTYDKSYVKGLPRAYQWYDAQRCSFNVTLQGGGFYFFDVPRFGSGVSISNTEIQKPWLKSIATDNQTVTFETSGRSDFMGAKKVDWIKVSDINGDIVSLHHLNYGTFAHSTVGGSCPNTSDYLMSDPRNGERLKLQSLSQVSIDKRDSLTHMFTYHEKHPLPLKTSAAVDFWGYYNGQENFRSNPAITDSRSLIPSIQDCFIGYESPLLLEPDALAIPGACRFSNGEKMIAGTLSSIIYPTGGKSVFTFEPHRFRSTPVYPLYKTGYKDINVEVEDLNYPSDKYSPGPVTHRQIDIEGEATGYLTVIFEARSGKTLRQLKKFNPDITVQPMGKPGYRKIYVNLDSCHNVNLESNYHKETFAVSLDKVSYMLIADLPSEVPYKDGWVKATLQLREIDSSLESGGAGLRIAAVDNYDDDGCLLGRKEYYYTDTGDSSSGKLLNGARATECRIKYYECLIETGPRNETKNIVHFAFTPLKIHSELCGSPSITNALSRGSVEYTRMEEREYSGEGNLTRSTVSEFRVRPTTEPLPDMHLLTEFGGGELVKKSFYDNEGNIIKTQDFEYGCIQSKSIKCNISIEDQFYHYEESSLMNRHAAPRYLIRVYPYPIWWRTLTGIRERDHSSDGIIESSHSITYNSSNKLVSEESIMTKNSGTRTTYKYPVDYNTTVYDKMCSSDYHLKGMPLEITNYEFQDGKYTESLRMRYQYSFHPERLSMLQLNRVEKSTAGGPTETPEIFTYSIEDGTLIGSVKDSVTKKAYLWSYAHTCPVAVVDGADYSTVQLWLTKEYISRLSNATDNIDTLLKQLRDKLKDKDVLLTTFTHKPLVGITSETRPNGETISYEYDSFNRLRRVLDNNGKVLETYSYEFR